MALSISPRKVVPLAGGDDWEPVKSKTAGTTTKRVFFCGVVVESQNGQGISEGALCSMVLRHTGLIS